MIFKEDWEALKVGDVVYALKTLDEWSDCHGHCIVANKHDKLIVRGFSDFNGQPWFSHEDRTDSKGFYADREELSLMKHFQH